MRHPVQQNPSGFRLGLLTTETPTLSSVTAQTHLAATGHAGARSWLWLRGDWLGEPDEIPRLWMHLDDGRVLAFLLPNASFGEEAVIGDLFAQVAEDRRGLLLAVDLPGGQAMPLYAAPAAPMPNLPWGDPRHAAAREFAAGLDQEVLRLLASLNRHRRWDSVRNYNRIAALNPMIREHRLQALTRFPVLTAPILLTAHQYLQFHGGKRHAWRDHDSLVIDAIERGRDLIQALASHYGISKGLVRAPICARMWGATGLSHRRLLKLLDGIPAHRRPHQSEELEPAIPLFVALNLLSDDHTDLRRLGRTALKQGLNVVCAYLHEHFSPLGSALADCRDFAAAAVVWARPQDVGVLGLTTERLELAWIESRGFRSLLSASQRWHQLRVDSHLEPLDNTRVIAILGEYRRGEGEGRELCEAFDLVREGEDMHHCVADYWAACLEQGTRIFSVRYQQERATAEYRFAPAVARFSLGQLRGPCNAEASPGMTAFARAIEAELNAVERVHARAELASQLSASGPRRQALWPPQAPLDPASERELERVLARLGSASENPNDLHDDLLRGYVAGYQYHGGASLEPQMNVGDALDLIREPHNPHDPLAVSLAWRGERIGYVPRLMNADIANRLDAGVPLHCRLSRFHEMAEPWERVEFVIRQAKPA